jgi:hypothetical protein
VAPKRKVWRSFSRWLSESEEEPSLFENHIETDRDSFTPSTRTIEAREWILESFYSFIDNRANAETHSFPELLVRFGLTDEIELRLGGNYGTEGWFESSWVY